MPVQIGAQSHSFTNPTGLLSDCHRRVEMFLGVLASVAEKMEQSPTEETSRALQSALRYFEQSAPKHTADEEESLFPRLRKIDHPEIRAAFTRLDDLENDHRRAAPLHAKVARLGTQYIADGGLSSVEIEGFRSAVASLVAMYNEHIRVEDDLVFPLAARMLSDNEKSAIASEMASRRDVLRTQPADPHAIHRPL